MTIWESPSHFLREVETQDSLIAVKTMVKDFVENYVLDLLEQFDNINFDLEERSNLRSFSEMSSILDMPRKDLDQLLFKSGMIDIVSQPTERALNLGWITYISGDIPALTPTGRLILGTFLKRDEIKELVEYE